MQEKKTQQSNDYQVLENDQESPCDIEGSTAKKITEEKAKSLRSKAEQEKLEQVSERTVVHWCSG